MIRYVGVDLHKRLVEFCFTDESGRVLYRKTLDDLSAPRLDAFAHGHLQPTDQVVLEATTNVWAVAAKLTPFVARVVVSHPVANKAIAHARIKTDKVDAEVLAHLLRLGYLVEVWQPDTSCRALREWTTRRTGLVSQRTGLINRLHSTLAQRLLTCPHDLTTPHGRECLGKLAVDDDTRWLLDSDLRLLGAVQAEIDAIDVQLAKRGYRDDRVKLLMTLPGVGQHTAQALLAAIGDIGRFRRDDNLAAYLGLVPSTRQSANRCYHGSITKQGRSHTRWILIQAAQSVRTHPGPLGHFFRRLKSRKNHNVAVVAVAHKLALLAWQVLTRNEPYRYALPRATEDKLRCLRVQATGEKRRGGLGKGIDPQKARASGEKGCTQRSLPDVYASEGVAPPSAAPAGESRHLKRLGLDEFAAGLSQTQVIPRRRKASPLDEPEPWDVS